MRIAACRTQLRPALDIIHDPGPKAVDYVAGHVLRGCCPWIKTRDSLVISLELNVASAVTYTPRGFYPAHHVTPVGLSIHERGRGFGGIWTHVRAADVVT